MSAPQSTILAAGQPFGFAGMVTQQLDGKSAANKEASTDIGFGLGVKPGTNVGEAKLPSASSSNLYGITTNRAVGAPGTFGSIDQSASPPGMIPNTFMDLITEGRVLVEVDADAAPTVDAGAYWRFETDGASNTKKGVFRETDDGHVVDTTKKVTFKSAAFTAADGVTKIAEVYVSISNKQ